MTAHQWKACSGEPLDLRGRDVFGWLDLSETKDLTALVLIDSDIRDGTWHERPTFWLPSEGLYDWARSDRIPYNLWHTQGHLETTPSSSISYEYVAQHLRTGVRSASRHQALAFDRWNLEHLKPWLLNASFSEQLIKGKVCRLRPRLRGYEPASRDLESIILEKNLRHGDHPVLLMYASNAVIDRDPAGNRKLSKKDRTAELTGWWL